MIFVYEVAPEGMGPEATRSLLLFGSGVDISNNFNSLSRFRLNASFCNNFSGLTGLGFCSSQPSTFPLSTVLINEEEPACWRAAFDIGALSALNLFKGDEPIEPVPISIAENERAAGSALLRIGEAGEPWSEVEEALRFSLSFWVVALMQEEEVGADITSPF